MSEHNPADFGYDAPASSSSVYLRLKAKGDKARIRIASRPFKFTEQYEATPDRPTREAVAHAWVVIHKELVDGKPVATVKAYKAGAMIYGLIYDLVKNPDWGNPTQYDIEITRTEQEGRYYTVQPLPKPMGPISEAHQKLVDEANLNLHSLFVERESRATENADSTSEDPFADD
jgi:hypothetical protein